MGPASFKTCSDCAALRDEVQALTPYEDEWPAFTQLGSECGEYDGDYHKRFLEIVTKRRIERPTP